MSKHAVLILKQAIDLADGSLAIEHLLTQRNHVDASHFTQPERDKIFEVPANAMLVAAGLAEPMQQVEPGLAELAWAHAIASVDE